MEKRKVFTSLELLEKALKRDVVVLNGYDTKVKEIERLLRAYKFEEEFTILIKTEEETEHRGKCEHHMQWGYKFDEDDESLVEFELQVCWRLKNKTTDTYILDSYNFPYMMNEQKAEYGPYLDKFMNELTDYIICRS